MCCSLFSLSHYLARTPSWYYSCLMLSPVVQRWPNYVHQLERCQDSHWQPQCRPRHSTSDLVYWQGWPRPRRQHPSIYGCYDMIPMFRRRYIWHLPEEVPVWTRHASSFHLRQDLRRLSPMQKRRWRMLSVRLYCNEKLHYFIGIIPLILIWDFLICLSP